MKKKTSSRKESGGRAASKPGAPRAGAPKKSKAGAAKPAKSSARKSGNVPADKLAAYEALVATRRDVERKGDKIPYTSVNGHMTSSLDGEGNLSLRLSDVDREAFVAKYKTPPVVAYGIVRKDYVAVPDALLRNTRELKPWFDKSFEHVRSLKPKPTTRPGKA